MSRQPHKPSLIVSIIAVILLSIFITVVSMLLKGGPLFDPSAVSN